MRGRVTGRPARGRKEAVRRPEGNIPTRNTESGRLVLYWPHAWRQDDTPGRDEAEVLMTRWRNRSTQSRLLAVLVLALAVAPCVWGQVFTLTKEQMLQYTAQNPFDRFPDGRPKVPDALLAKLKDMSAEE